MEDGSQRSVRFKMPGQMRRIPRSEHPLSFAPDFPSYQSKPDPFGSLLALFRLTLLLCLLAAQKNAAISFCRNGPFAPRGALSYHCVLNAWLVGQEAVGLSRPFLHY